MNELIKVDFNGQELLATKDEAGSVLVAMKPICENLGLKWDFQREKINEDEILKKVTQLSGVPTKRGVQQSLCLPLEFLNGWLFGIQENRIKESIRPMLLQYKKECYNTLYSYFHKGVAVNQQFPDIENILESSLKTIREQRLELAHKQSQIEQLKPANEFVDKVFKQADTNIKIGDFAQVVKIPDPEKPKTLIGQKKMFKLLRHLKILKGNNLPMQNYLEAGLFEVKERIGKQKEKEVIYLTTYVTPKGQTWLHKRLLEAVG